MLGHGAHGTDARTERRITPTGGSSSERSRRLWLAYLSGAFGLAMFAQATFLVSLRARELGASFDVIGVIVGAGALAPALLAVTLGSVTDRLGPKRTFVLGAAATALVSALFVLVTNYWWFLVLQPVLGVARNLGWLASQGYITSAGTPEERPALAGRFSFFTNVGHMLGPVLAGTAAQLVGFRWALLVPVLYAACFSGLGLLLPGTAAGEHDAPRVAQGTGIRSALELVVGRGMQVALLLSFARLWTAMVYSTFLPVYLVDTGFEPGVVGTVMATSGFVAALMAPTTGFWTRRGSPQTVAVLGLACGTAGLLLAPHVAAVPVVYVVPALVGIGAGLSLPLLLSLVTSAAPAHKRGVALGLRAMVNEVAGTVAPLVVGPLIAALGMVLGFTGAGLVGAAMLASARGLHAVDRREQRAAR